MIYFLDYVNCEILFISYVNSSLDDSMILCASELKFLSVFPFVFISLAQYLKILSSRICAVLFFCCYDDMIGTYDHLSS